MSQPAPSPRKGRWRRGVLLGAVALLALLVAGAVVFRTQIATALATAYLEARGVAVRSLAVTRLTFDAVEITGLSLGAAQELTAARIALEPVFDGLQPGVAAASIEGLQLDLDLTGAGPPLGSLQPALERLVSGESAAAGGGQDDDNGASALPHITIADSILRFDTTIGPLTASLEGSLDSGGGRFALVLPGEAEHLELLASVRRDAAAPGGTFAVAIDGELRTAGALARLLALPGPAVTAGTLVVAVAGEVSPDGSRIALSGDAVLADGALADGTEGISGHLPLALEVAGGRATVTLTQDAVARVERPSRDSLLQLGVPDDLLPLLASGLNIALAHAGDLPLRLAATPAWPPERIEIAAAAEAASDQGLTLALMSEGTAMLGDALALTGFDGSLEARATAQRLAIDGREAQGVELALPLAVDYGDGLDLALARPGALRIARFGAKTPLQLASPLAFEIGTLTLTAPGDAAGYRYALAAREDGAAFTIAAAGAKPVAVTAGGFALQLDGRFAPQGGHVAKLTLRLGGLDLPGYGFDAEAAQVEVALDSALRPASSRFSLGPFQLGGEPAATAPLALAGTLQRKGSGYDIAGTLSLAGGQALADLVGRYGDNGRASLEAKSRLLAFSPDGLQPGALSPLLAGLEEVSGTVAASARLAWPREPSRESGRAALDNLSFKTGGVEIAGLSLVLELDSLMPLASAAGQRLSLRRLEAGVPVENVELTFALDQAPRPRLDLEDGGFDLGGARWTIAPTALDPAAARNRIVLATDALELATFFDLIDVAGLTGSGTLTGALPVVFAGDDIIVEDGYFNALGPGRLAIRFQALRQALAGGGQTVEAAARALEDFHYEELSLELSKTADNDATVKLSTLGQNPAVMDGQPFRFNINLESNLTSVLEALRQGYSLSDDALQRAWQLRQ